MNPLGIALKKCAETQKQYELFHGAPKETNGFAFTDGDHLRMSQSRGALPVHLIDTVKSHTLKITKSGIPQPIT